MGVPVLLKIIFSAVLLLASLNAEETKENHDCDTNYNICIDKCEQSDNASEGCLNTCEDNYEKCLISTENGKQDSD